MKLFLDSAKVDEIEHALTMWNIDGLTTNPKHIRDSGKAFHAVLKEIAQLFEGTDKPVSVEVNPYLNDWKQIVEQGLQLADLSPGFVIKIGASEAGFRAMRELASQGLKVNATLIFTVAQAWHAARAGAAYISPFVGWKEQFADPADDLIPDIISMLDNYGYSSEVIAAAIRNVFQIAAAAVAGSHCITAAFAVYLDSFQSPYTAHGDRLFQEAWDATPGQSTKKN